MTSPAAGGGGAIVRAGVAVGRGVGTGVGAGVDGLRVWGGAVTIAGAGGSSVAAFVGDGVSVGVGVSVGDGVAATASLAVSVGVGVALAGATMTPAAARGPADPKQLDTTIADNNDGPIHRMAAGRVVRLTSLPTTRAAQSNG